MLKAHDNGEIAILGAGKLHLNGSHSLFALCLAFAWFFNAMVASVANGMNQGAKQRTKALRIDAKAVIDGAERNGFLLALGEPLNGFRKAGHKG